MTPDSDFLVPPKKRVSVPILFSKCSSSHCSNVDEAVSAVPTNKCKKPQKKYSMSSFSSILNSAQLSTTLGNTSKR